MTTLREQNLIAVEEARERDLWHGCPPVERALRLVPKRDWIGEADREFRRAADRRARDRAGADRRL